VLHVDYILDLPFQFCAFLKVSEDTRK